MNQTRGSLIKNLLMVTLGMFPLSFGVYSTIQAGIGVSPWDALALGLAGLCITHLCGMLQYMNLAELDFFAAALIMSIPYLLKDIASVAAAFAVGMAVKKRLPQERSVPERL